MLTVQIRDTGSGGISQFVQVIHVLSVVAILLPLWSVCEFWNLVNSNFVYSIWTAWTKIFRDGPKFFLNVLKNMVTDLKILVRVLKYFNQCTILCCTKNPVTHTHTHTLRVQTQLSHSDKPPKQTKTETTQQGSHRQKFPRSEVIRCY